MRVLLGAMVAMVGTGVAMMVGAGMALGQGATQGETVPRQGKTVPLWPGRAPHAVGTAAEDTPTLTIFLPTKNSTKTGVVVAPGGGYEHLAMAKEGTDIARWLNERGVAAFVLQYRLGPVYHAPVELEDAQRAIRMVRSQAAEFGILPDHVGMCGFSAGGHLAATAGTHFDAGDPAAGDAIERQGSRPDFLILAYPVITMEAPYVHAGSRKYLLGDDPEQAVVENLSDETQVTKQTPPTVPVMNSVMFYEALVKAGVPAEMHLFQHGSHGAGLAAANPELSVWPELLIKWMRERGLASAEDVSTAP
jgi:acetyl esterase/lipase